MKIKVRRFDGGKLLDEREFDTQKMYDYRNNFLTMQRFADYYGITLQSAQQIVYGEADHTWIDPVHDCNLI